MKRIKRVISNNVYMLKLLCWAAPKKLWLNLLMTVWGCILKVISTVVFMRTLVNEIEAGNSFGDIVLFVLFMFVFQFVTQYSISIYDSFYLPSVNMDIRKKLQTMFYRKVATIDLSCIENPEFFEGYIKANRYLWNKMDEVLNITCSIVSVSFMMISMSAVLITINPLLAIIAFVPFLYSLFFSGKINKKNYEYNLEDQKITHKTDYVHRTFYSGDYSKEMRSSKISGIMFDKYGELMKTIRRLSIKRLPFYAATDLGSNFVNDYVVNKGTYLFAGILTVLQKITLGDFFVAASAIMSLSQSLSAAVGLVHGYSNTSLYIEDIRTFLEYEPSVKLNPHGIRATDKNKHIEVKNVSFKYDSMETDCLKNISFEIKPNEKIAIVGHNGAGKTTLVKLLMHLYEIDRGEILLDGKNIRDYELGSYRMNFGTVFQDYQVLSISAIENVLMKDNITQAERETAIAAMKEVGIYDRIAREPRGVDTVLSKEFDEDGTVLSGGEYQKIAIARIFAKQCGVVILDEPSSALDPIAEHDLYSNMMKACKDKTVIFISHRLSSAVNADRIILLENGEIIEIGTHKELMMKNGKYATMFKRQAENYAEEVAK